MDHKSIAFMRLAAAGAVFVGFLFVGSDQQMETDFRPEARASIGTDDDPEARAMYELTRLRNPATGMIPRRIRAKELEFAATLPTRESLSLTPLSKGNSLSESRVVSWSGRGPYNVGGRTRAVAYDVANVNNILAGGVSGGMWKTVNGGTSWTNMTAPASLHGVTCIVQDTRAGNTNKWYYGTGEYLGNSATGGGPAFFTGDGIFKSTDNGSSWTLLPSTSTGVPQTFDSFFDYIWSVAVDPSNLAQDEVYAATYGVIFRSTNGGTSWTGVLGGSSPYSTYTDVKVTSTGIVYVAGSSGSSMSGIRRSTDGVTYTPITPAGFPTVYSRITIAIAPSNQNVVYFLVQGANGTNGIDQINGHQLWKYTDNTASWASRGQNLPNEAGLVNNAVFETQSGYDMYIQVRPNDENFLIVGCVNLYRSTDAFATTTNWSRIGGYANPTTYNWYANHHPDQHGGMFQPGSNTIYLSSHDEGLSRTADVSAGTVSWTQINNGYLTTQFYTVAIDHLTAGNNIVIGGMQDNGTWFINNTTATTPWLQIYGGDGAACAIANGRTSYYASSQNGVIYRFLIDDNGNPIGNPNFTRVDPTGASGYLFINPFVLDPTNTNRMYLAGGDRIWRNSDLTAIPLGSNSTTALNWTNMTNSAIAGATVSALSISTATPANRLYYGTNNGKVYRIDGANSGDPLPTDIWTGKGFPAGAYVSCIAVDPQNANNAMAVFSNYSVVSLFYTSNGGTSWTAVAGNLEQFANGTGTGPSVRWMQIVPGNGTKYYFAATSTGLYSTELLNGASTVWSLEGSSTIGNVVIDMLDSRTNGGLVVVGTHGYGAFSGTVPLPLDVEEGGRLPDRFALHQNYPNPFNPSTTLSFSVPSSSYVTLKVYDIAGREVATVVDEEMNRGFYERTFDAAKFASGVYMYELRAGSYSEARKMLVAK